MDTVLQNLDLDQNEGGMVGGLLVVGYQVVGYYQVEVHLEVLDHQRMLRLGLVCRLHQPRVDCTHFC